MILTFEVTQDDIDNSEQGVKGQCAMASGLKCAHGDKYGYVSIDKFTIQVRGLATMNDSLGRRCRIVATWTQPYPNWIMNFDKDRTTVDPITVRLDTDLATVRLDPIKSSGSSSASRNRPAVSNGQAGKRRKTR
jgi:hypothetical protein